MSTFVHRGSRIRLAAVAAAFVLAALLALGIYERIANVHALRHIADEESIPQVEVIGPVPGPASRTMTLPGTIRAWYTAPIYAQVSGYVLHWYKDYGAAVKTNELLADIDAPGVDEQYQSALASLQVAQTNYKLAVVTARRWKALAGTQAVSQQEIDVRTANADAQKAQVAVAEHQVARYKVLEAFKKVVAPFDGVVTARNTDVGGYVNAAGGDVNNRGSADELFSVSDVHEMRVFVSVPQDYSELLREPGLKATLTLPQFPNRTFEATFSSSANAFNPETRTAVAELLVPNPDRLIWPGAYANVHFVVPLNPHIVTIPEQALVFRAQGTQVAVVDANDTIHLKSVVLGLNLGQAVQVTSGLEPSDKLVMNPSAGIMEGQKVAIVSGARRAGAGSEASARSANDPSLSAEQRAKIESARHEQGE